MGILGYIAAIAFITGVCALMGAAIVVMFMGDVADGDLF